MAKTRQGFVLQTCPFQPDKRRLRANLLLPAEADRAAMEDKEGMWRLRLGEFDDENKLTQLQLPRTALQ